MIPASRTRSPSLLRKPLIVLATSLPLLIAACGGDRPESASQVAATVNGNEITVHQINHALRQARGVTADNAPQARQRILEQLISQELLVQQAKDMALDRDPQILLALEASRRSILARAYLERKAAAAQTPAAAEVRSYYAEHPELFADRHLYRFDEFTLGRLPEDGERFLAQLEKAGNLPEAVGLVRKAGGDVVVSSNVVRPAERLPRDLLPKLAQGGVGSMHIYRAGNALTVAQVREIIPAPVSEGDAGTAIGQLLLGNERREAIESDIRRLRENADIAYVGEFLPDASAGAANAQAAPIDGMSAATVGTDGGESADADRQSASAGKHSCVREHRRRLRRRMNDVQVARLGSPRSFARLIANDKHSR
ncbi:MAG: EpsD family peptidyl-prolyl cis-trans isomerase [Burkholderiaceae bacterium]|nr:EpsD family peptidyl-prolyl cis-trans isomerase [Burkholderiaceae bacterium]